MSDLKPWPLAGYAPGNYFCKCTDCGNEFEGDKRAFTCLECAVTAIKSRADATAISERDRRIEALEAERNEAERLKCLWFETHLSHRTACEALGRANGELLKRAMDAERRADASRAECEGLRAARKESEKRAIGNGMAIATAIETQGGEK